MLVLVLVALVGYFLSAIGPARIDHRDAARPRAARGVLFAVRIIDRWEPEPRGLLVLAVAWGAIAAVGIALGVDLLMTHGRSACDDSLVRDAFSAVVQAPIVEEFAKGLGVYLIFVTARRAFDGPVDGIVYGALDRRGLRVHREHPVLRDQLHRGRRRRRRRPRSSCAASSRRSRT